VAAITEDSAVEESAEQHAFADMEPVQVSVGQQPANSGFGDDLDLPEFFR
jgi:hypothetical protein